MKNNINLADIKTFVVLAQAGSFTRAAEDLMCSRSHISKQLTQLESALGISLLTRTTRTQKLTPQGEAFYIRCKQALDTIDLSIERAIESASSLSGSININCVGGHIGEGIIAPLIDKFLERYPDINIQLDFTSQRVDLISGEFDFVFRMGELNDSRLIAKKLINLPIGTLVSPDYIAKYGEPTSPKDLVHHKCIVGSLKNWVFNHQTTSESLDITVSRDMICKNGRVMLSWATSGKGIIRVPELYCKTEVNQKKLIPLFDNWKIEPTSLYLVYLQDKHRPLRIQVFKDYVIENFQQFLN